MIAEALYLLAGNCKQTDEMITLYKIDFSQDTIVTAILSDVFLKIDSLRYNPKPYYYDMLFVKENKQTKVVMIGHTRKCIDDVQRCVGYVIYRGKTVFVYSTGKYKLNYCKPLVTMTFKIRKQLPMPYDPYEWLYIIKSNRDERENWYRIDLK